MTTENSKNPTAVVVPSGVAGLDLALKNIQLKLATISWLEKAFGRAWTLPTISGRDNLTEPKVYQGNNEYYPVLANDALKSYSFFRVPNARKTEDYLPIANFGNFMMNDAIDLICWFNMKLIDSSKTYIFKEELIKDVLNAINNDPNIIVNAIWDDKVEDIFSGYSIDRAKRDLLKYPYGAFRLELNFRYEFSCTPSAPEPPSYLNPVWLSWAISGSLTLEVGSNVAGSRTSTWSINPNDGIVATIDIYDVTGSAVLVSNTPNDGSQAFTLPSRVLNSDGATQQVRGILHDTDVVQDINSSVATITARFNMFYGPSASAPGNSAAIRALTSRFKTPGSDQFNLMTGTTNTIFTIALPPGVTLVSVIDLDAFNVDITSAYVSQGTMSVNDAGGTARTYSIYRLTNAIPYSTTHRHQITTS